MYLALAIILVTVVSLAAAIEYNIEQLVYGQGNLTGDNMTAGSGNMTAGTEDVNTTKGSVSGGLAVSDEGASGKKK